MAAEQIRVTLNGEERSVPEALSVADLLRHLGLHPGMVVVERNRKILRREAYEEEPVEQDDLIELVQFVGGG